MSRIIRENFRVPRSRGGYVMDGLGAVELGTTSNAALAALAVKLDREWHPTGFYTPADISAIAKQLTAVYAATRKPLADFLRNAETNPIIRAYAPYFASRAREQVRLTDEAYAQVTRYSHAAISAVSSGYKYLDAPGLKRMTVGFLKAMSLRAAKYRELAAEYNAMAKGDWTDAVANFLTDLGSGFIGIVTGAGQVIMTVGGVAADVARAAGNALGKIPDLIGDVFTVLKWGALGVAALFAYRELRPRG